MSEAAVAGSVTLGTILICALTLTTALAGDEPFRTLGIGVATTGALGVLATFTPALRLPAMLGALAVHMIVVGSAIPALFPAGMDVHLFNREAANALIAGTNPYELRYENIIGQGSPLYAAELQVGDRLAFGYPYPPLPLLLALPGQLLGADYRFASLAAVDATALLLLLMRPGPLGAAAATLLLVSPLPLRVIFNGWIEPFVGLAMAGVVIAALRVPRLVPLLLGLAIAMKQYVAPIWFLALVLLRDGRKAVGFRRMAVVPLAVAALTVLPFVLWSPEDFFFSTAVVQVLQPPRMDAASVPGLISRLGGPLLSGLGFAGLGLAMTISAWRSESTLAGFTASTAFCFLAFFAFSKQTVMNYFYFALVCLICATATAFVAQDHDRFLSSSVG